MKIRGTAKVFVIMGLTMLALLLLFHLPILKVGDTQLRKIDMLADLDPEGGTHYDSVPDAPEAPKGPWKDVWPKGVEPILDYGTDSTCGMDRFYAALAQSKKLGRPVRIAYLSDSFVEGDIMLVDLRHLLQKHFGDGGLGWLRCRTNFDEGTYAANLSSSGFETHHVMKRKSLSMAHYILPQGYAEVMGNASCSVSSLTGDFATTWKHATVWGFTNSSATVSGAGKTVNWSASNAVQTAQFDAPGMSSFTTSISGNAKVFGMSLENDNGIVLDNFGVRGSSGFNLVDMAEGLSVDFAKKRPYDMVVIHFGLNAINRTSTDKTCIWYTDAMKKCVERIKKLYPQSAVLIVSASDMAARNPSTGKVETIPAVEALVGYQRKMAADMQVGFVSIYDVMGGRNSVVRMAEQGIGERDYTHIKRQGGKVVAEKFVKSFIAGFDNYKRKKAAGY